MNPYKPDTKEYLIISNLLECQDHIAEYIKECPACDIEELKTKVLELIEMHNIHHVEIVNGE